MTRVELMQQHIVSAERDVVIGVDDCGPWVVQWIRLACGREVKFPRYRTREEAYGLIKTAGSLVALVDPLLADVGITRTDYPEYGDVVVVRLSKRDVAGIMCDGGLVLFRGEERGATFINPGKFLLAAWRVPDNG